MLQSKKKLFFIKFPYWLGIAADALWAVALFVPQVFGLLTGNPDFNPDNSVRLIMGIGGSLMAGWTFLLIWAVRNPFERRAVSLLTACPVIVGLFFVALIGFIDGSASNIWILVKLLILFTLMITSFLLAGNMELNNSRN